MKLYKFSAILALAAGLFMTSCDNIADNPEDRFIPVDRIESTRSVLIMEFTGQRCMNCPEGAAAVQKMIDVYGDNIIPLSLHPENTIFTLPYPTGAKLTSSIATEYYKYYNSPSSFPCAVFDGQMTANSNNYKKWEDDAKAAMEKGSPAMLKAYAQLSNDTHEVVVNYDAEFTYNYDAPLNVVVWIVESGLVAPQQTANGSVNRNYVNKHVLRASFNGTWGEPLGEGSGYENGRTYSGTVSGLLDPTWVPENCNIIVALISPDSKYVQQAAESHIF